MDYKTLLSAVAMGTGVTGFNTHATEVYEPPQLSQESIVAFCERANGALVLDGKDVCKHIQASKAATPPVTSTISPSTVTPPSIDVVPIEEVTKKSELLVGISLVAIGGAYLLNRKRVNNQEKRREAILNMLAKLGITIDYQKSSQVGYFIDFHIPEPDEANKKMLLQIGILNNRDIFLIQPDDGISLDSSGLWQTNGIYKTTIHHIHEKLHSKMEEYKRSLRAPVIVKDEPRTVIPTEIDPEIRGLYKELIRDQISFNF